MGSRARRSSGPRHASEGRYRTSLRRRRLRPPGEVGLGSVRSDSPQRRAKTAFESREPERTMHEKRIVGMLIRDLSELHPAFARLSRRWAATFFADRARDRRSSPPR